MNQASANRAYTPRMPRPSKPGSPFGERLIELRKARNMTQEDLAKAIGTTNRAISYYEAEGGNPPLDTLVAMAKELRCSSDALLGLTKLKTEPITKGDGPTTPEEKRLWNKFRQLRKLPDKDQRAVIRLVNSLMSN